MIMLKIFTRLLNFTIIGVVGFTGTMANATENKPLMIGFPPAIASQVTFANYLTYPYSKWAFNFASAPLNVVQLPRKGQIAPFKQSLEAELGKQTIELADNRRLSLEQVFAQNETDGVVILKNNEIKYERYWHYGEKDRHHIWFSATKSLVSAAFGILVEQGKVDLNASPVKYLPELKNSGFARTTIQQVLNHSSGINFKENYTDLSSNFFKFYAPALNMAWLPGGRDTQPGQQNIYGVHDFLAKYIQPDHKILPGEVFDYNSANADVIGWLITRISGQSLNDFIQQNIWAKLQVEHDAFMAVDRAYMPVATGGMNSTTRDAARFGAMILNDGQFAGQQVIPKNWLQQINLLSNKDKDKMSANGKYQNESWQAYKNMWWVLNADKGEFAAVGIYGQVIYINQAKSVVAAYFSSQPVATAANNQMFRDKLAAVRQIANTL